MPCQQTRLLCHIYLSLLKSVAWSSHPRVAWWIVDGFWFSHRSYVSLLCSLSLSLLLLCLYYVAAFSLSLHHLSTCLYWAHGTVIYCPVQSWLYYRAVGTGIGYRAKYLNIKLHSCQVSRFGRDSPGIWPYVPVVSRFTWFCSIVPESSSIAQMEVWHKHKLSILSNFSPYISMLSGCGGT